MSYGSEFQAPRSLWQRNWRCWLAMPSKPVRNRQRRAERAMSDIDGSTLDRLFAVIAARRGADSATSYTAKLLRAGKSADVLYHLLVAWADAGIAPAEIWRALEARQGRSGIAEKQSRTGG